MAGEVRVDYSEIINNLGKLAVKTEYGLLMYATTKAAQLQSYMQVNRPWTDRTGTAKATMTGRAAAHGTGVRIELSYGVWYGIYLERAHEQRYAIIEPTIRVKGPEVMQGVKDLISKVKL